ncbi:MAG: pyridoxamine 5'-phosphate oxidase family protein [Anaerolineae bacterium]|nr:pyridoxamine 5'-phosphate oxidase family protein [Anaerolineae bacterium]
MHIPESHQDLIEGRYCAALTTLLPNGFPQTTVVWCETGGEHVLINTMKQYRKAKNMRADPRVTLLIYDPQNPLRNLEIRGDVIEMTEEGAVEHNDHLTAFYMDKPGAKFFGDAVPAELAETYTPVKITIKPTRIRTEG